MRQGFDNAKYIELQAAHIKERISQFGGKLYLEFGGKLFDDYHASRVLPGFEPDSKFRMLKSIADDVEVIIAINANHIEKNKARGDLGITYDEDVLRLVDLFRGNGFAVARMRFGWRRRSRLRPTQPRARLLLIDEFLKFLAGAEEGQAFRNHRDAFPGFGVAPGVATVFLDFEAAEPADFYPFPGDQRFFHGVDECVHNQ